MIMLAEGLLKITFLAGKVCVHSTLFKFDFTLSMLLYENVDCLSQPLSFIQTCNWFKKLTETATKFFLDN